MEALHDLIKLGKVRYIGASSMWATQFAQMQFCAEKHGWTKFVSMQNHYNLLYREEEREMNRYCNETGVGLIPVCYDPFHFLLDFISTFYQYYSSSIFVLKSRGYNHASLGNMILP